MAVLEPFVCTAAWRLTSRARTLKNLLPDDRPRGLRDDAEVGGGGVYRRKCA